MPRPGACYWAGCSGSDGEVGASEGLEFGPAAAAAVVEGMVANMLQFSTVSSTSGPTIIDRVGSALAALACTRVWVRGAGRHVLLGQGTEEPFARVTAFGAGSYGLAFRGGVAGGWETLLVDDLPAVVEHALIGADAVPT